MEYRIMAASWSRTCCGCFCSHSFLIWMTKITNIVICILTVIVVHVNGVTCYQTLLSGFVPFGLSRSPACHPHLYHHHHCHHPQQRLGTIFSSVWSTPTAPSSSWLSAATTVSATNTVLSNHYDTPHDLHDHLPQDHDNDHDHDHHYRSQFWGQDRSEDEIRSYLVCDKWNIVPDDIQVLSLSPPVVVIHNLLSPEQCQTIINGAMHQTMIRSTTYVTTTTTTSNSNNNTDSTTTTTSPTSHEDDEEDAHQPVNQTNNETTTSEMRTSSTVWLHDNVDDDDFDDKEGDDDDHDIPTNHKDNPIMDSSFQQHKQKNFSRWKLSQTLRQLADYASHMSGLPPQFMENLQVVRYLPGQEFQLHTDHLDSFNHAKCNAGGGGGGRLATCLFYLQAPTSGGDTYFPCIHHLHISPTCGSALFFWNTIEKPGCFNYHDTMFLHVDERMKHAGLPVLSGEKWICNRWIHPNDYGAGVRGL